MSQLDTQLDPQPTRPVSPSLALVGASPSLPVRRGQRGLVSAEWAMAIIAAVAIVGVVVGLLTDGPFKALLLGVITTIIKGAVTHI